MTLPQPNSPVQSSPRPERLQRISSSSSYSAGVVAGGDRPGSTDRPPSSFQQGPAVDRASLDSPSKLVKMPSRASMSLARTGESSNVRAASIHSSRNSVDGGRDSFATARGEIRTVKEEEFDALLTSGQTMKVSLTPSRLKRFDVSSHRTGHPGSLMLMANAYSVLVQVLLLPLRSRPHLRAHLLADIARLSRDLTAIA